jgi:hypothetical protein
MQTEFSVVFPLQLKGRIYSKYAVCCCGCLSKDHYNNSSQTIAKEEEFKTNPFLKLLFEEEGKNFEREIG